VQARAASSRPLAVSGAGTPPGRRPAAYSRADSNYAVNVFMAKSASAAPWFKPGSPLYLEVRRRIADAIRSGEWRPGDAIPPEKQLCERFGISMGTLRKAVDELTASGVLVRQQGRGTFVARHSQDRYLFTFFHLVGHDGHKEYPGIRMRAFGTAVADDLAAEVLAVKPGSPLHHLSNALSLRGEVMSLDEIYLPFAVFPGLTEERLRERKTTLYQMYQDEFDVTVVRASERVRAFAATRSQARLLKTDPGAPLLQIIRVVYAFQDRPVELRYSYVDTRHCEYRPNAYYRERG
jgi:GntR family transcriptional regulator